MGLQRLLLLLPSLFLVVIAEAKNLLRLSSPLFSCHPSPQAEDLLLSSPLPVLPDRTQPTGCPIHRALCDGWDEQLFASHNTVVVVVAVTLRRSKESAAVAVSACCRDPSPKAEDLLLSSPLPVLPDRSQTNGCPIHRALCDGWDERLFDSHNAVVVV
jgi:hypothetical protein